MRNIFKTFITILSTTLALCGCSLLPSNYSEQNSAENCTIQFDNERQECKVNETGQNSIRVINSKGKYIAFDEVFVSCSNRFASYELHKDSNTSYLISYTCTAEREVTFTVNIAINGAFITNSFVVSFVNSSSVQPSNAYEARCEHANKTVYMDPSSEKSFLCSLISKTNGSNVKIDDVVVNARGYADYTYSFLGDYSVQINLTSRNISTTANVQVDLYLDGNKYTFKFTLVVDTFSVLFDYNAPFICDEGNSISISVYGINTGRNREIRSISFFSEYRFIEDKIVSGSSQTKVTTQLYPVNYNVTEKVNIEITCSDGGFYTTSILVDVIENITFEVVNQDFPTFNSLTRNSSYSFDLKVYGVHSGTQYQIMSIDLVGSIDCNYFSMAWSNSGSYASFRIFTYDTSIYSAFEFNILVDNGSQAIFHRDIYIS